MLDSPLFDVESFRSLPARHCVSPAVTRTTLVLGSTQRVELVAKVRVQERAVDVVRRRGGGGAVLLGVGDHLWVDAWVPRSDPLWAADVSDAAVRIGNWWRRSLAGLGVDGLEVHEGRARPGEFGELVCFAGRGPGEVFHHGRKVMGLSQWRCREGTLFSTCAYVHWEPRPLIDLVHVHESVRSELMVGLTPLAVGLADLEPVGVTDLGALWDVLQATFPDLTSSVGE